MNRHHRTNYHSRRTYSRQDRLLLSERRREEARERAYAAEQRKRLYEWDKENEDDDWRHIHSAPIDD